MKRGLNAHGYSFVEIVIAMGVMSFTLLAIATINAQLKQITVKTTGQTGIELFRESLISAVLDKSAWRQTYLANSGEGGGPPPGNPWCQILSTAPGCPSQDQQPNGGQNPGAGGSGGGSGGGGGGGAAGKFSGNMDCLRYGTQCVGINNQSFALVDGAGNLIYNALNPSEGFTPAGRRCTTYAPNNATGECYFRYNLRWTALCTGGAGCVNPMVSVDATLSVSQNAKSPVSQLRYSIPGTYRMAQ